MAADNDADTDREQYLMKLAKLIREELPPQCSAVMLMRYEEGLQYQEIADKLGISKVAVYKHLKNGIDIIKKKIN